MIYIVHGTDLLLIVVFALAFGGQMFDTVVNVPVIFDEPPGSIAAWIKTPTSERTPAYFRSVIVLALVAGAIGVAVWFIERPGATLLVSSLCALAYVALVFLFFLPTNQKLGFLPAAGEAPAELRVARGEIVRLAGRWRMWNWIRLAIQFVGLVCAGFGAQG